MSEYDWTEFRNGNSFGTDPFRENAMTVFSATTGPLTGGSALPLLRTMLDNNGVAPKIRGRMYNGPDIGNFPTKYCAISMVCNGRLSNFSSSMWGPFISPNFLGTDPFFQTPTPDADIDMIMCGFNAVTSWGGTSRQIRTRRIIDGVVNAAGEANSASYTTEIGFTGFTQFEVAFILDDLVPGSELFRIMARFNHGSEISLPGSVDWTDWEEVGGYDYATDIVGAGIDISSGFYVGYGFYVGSTSAYWDDTGFASNNQIELDDVRVVNYSAVAP